MIIYIHILYVYIYIFIKRIINHISEVGCTSMPFRTFRQPEVAYPCGTRSQLGSPTQLHRLPWCAESRVILREPRVILYGIATNH